MLQREPGARPEAAQVRQWVKEFQLETHKGGWLVKTNTGGSAASDMTESSNFRERRGSI